MDVVLTYETLIGCSQADAKLIEYAKENIYVATHANHQWLFPKCSAIVHHGGAGTTIKSLNSGIPTIVVPGVTTMLAPCSVHQRPCNHI